MIIREVASSGFWKSPYERQAAASTIVLTTARALNRPENRHPLSIRLVRNAREEFAVNGARLKVDDDCYLILNDSRSYSSRLVGQLEASSLHIFFSTALVNKAYDQRLTDDDRWIAPAPESEIPFGFVEQLYAHDRTISPILRYIESICAGGHDDQQWYEEQLLLLLQRMLGKHREVLKEIHRIDALKHSTKLEIYRRLTRAKDFIVSNYDRSVAIRDIADKACLSVPHLHILFKRLYGIPPHRFLQRKRMAVACRLLEDSRATIAEIAATVGMDSRSAFFRAFRSLKGVSPRDYRQQVSQLGCADRVR